jgi:hypothetical protein
VRFEVLTAVITNVAIFWDIAPCSLHRPSHLLQLAFSLGYFPTLKMEVINFSETKVRIENARSHNPEDWNIRE